MCCTAKDILRERTSYCGAGCAPVFEAAGVAKWRAPGGWLDTLPALAIERHWQPVGQCSRGAKHRWAR
jgi:hypothetical protein